MPRPLTLEFDWCTIKLHNEITFTAGVSFTFVQKSDNESNMLPEAERPTFVHELDNHQAYELAMSILSSIDVADTRGSR